MPSETELRKWRDRAFGYQLDASWQACKAHWANDWLWLSREYAKLIAKEAKL